MMLIEVELTLWTRHEGEHFNYEKAERENATRRDWPLARR